MHSIRFILAALIAAAPLSAQEDSRLPAKELTTRGGTPNFIAKLKAGGEVRIGYLGGSITAAPGWRVKSLKWFQQQYPSAKVSEINAAIGGTGSSLGVFRAQQDVISKKPDLLFIEFAVNDGGPSEKVQRAMEGIVRQTWKANPETDICFVYTLSEPMLEGYQQGKFTSVATAMEGVAGHYAIPAIAFGPEVAERVKGGKLIFKGTREQAENKEGPPVFSTDGVHPLVGTGHEVYQEVIARSFTAMKDAGTAGPHKVAEKQPLRADNWEDAKIVPITQSMLKGAWTKLDSTQLGRAKDFANRLPEMWKTEEPGASLEFALQGSVAQLYGLLGPDGGVLEVKVDEEQPKKITLFDQHCTYHRLGAFELLSAPAAGRHTIKVALTPEMPDKAKILSEANRQAMEKNPEPFRKISWQVGSLLVLGEVGE